MATRNRQPSGDGNGGAGGERVSDPIMTAFEMQQRQAQALLEANRVMAEGFFASLSMAGEAASVVAESVRRRATTGDVPFGPLSLWMLSKEDEAKFEEDIAKSFDALMTSAKKATETLTQGTSVPAH